MVSSHQVINTSKIVVIAVCFSESTSVSQRVSSEAQVVVSDATTSTRAASLFTSTNLDEIITAPNKIGGELVCPSGFILRELDLNCEQCDSVCLPGACIKFVGCNQCPPGYFTSRRDNQFPFKCRLCDIPHCTQCRSGIIDGLPPRCIKCKDGYVEIDDGLQCIGIAAQGVSTGPNASSPAPTDPIPICKLNQFLGADGACYLCSVHCASGNCIPGEGCSKCRNGYFRRKVRAVGFFTCQKCEAAGCDECKEDVLGTGLPQCKTCSPGYSPGLQEGSCSASNGLASAFGTQSRSASTTLSAAISQRTESINVQSEKSQTKTLITRGISTSREDDTLSNDVDPIPAQTGGKSTENFTIEDLQKSITSTTSTSAASVLTDRAVNHTSDGQTSQCGNNEFSFRNLEGESICRLCNIDLCESCVDNPDTATIQCSRCHAGHSLSKDRDACLQIPQDSERSEKVIGRSSEAAITDLTQTRTARVQSEELSCSDGYFVKACNSEHTCTPCDAHCMANQCIDIFGCLRCESGYTLITVKESFVLSCSPCEITDCQECLDGGAQSSAQMCSTCRPGYNLTADRSQCIDIKDEDQHESSRESMPDSIDTNFLDYIEDDMTKNEDPGAPWPSDSEDSIPVAAPNEESP